MSAPNTDNPVAEATILVVAPEETISKTSMTPVFFYHILRDNFILAVAGLNRCILVPVSRICNNVGRVVYGDEAVVMMPQSTLTFFITVLLACTEIKSQGKTGFPFQTHPKSIMVSVTSVVVYGFASAAELMVSAADLHPTSVYAVIARLGRIASLYILVASLAALFYF